MTEADVPMSVRGATALVGVAALVGSFTTVCAESLDTGRALYLDGVGAEVILARGEVQLPATRFPCARCHGVDGRGSREGGTLMPPVVWNRLSIATVDRAAYDAPALVKAVTAGIDASGEPLGELMPRYTASTETLDDLVGYIRQLDRLQQTGITPKSVRVRAPSKSQRRAGFLEAIKAFNRQGGSYGRRVDVVDDGEALVDADALFDVLARELPELLRKTLIDTLREDGLKSVSLSDDEPEPSMLYELQQAGLEFDADSRALLMDKPIDAAWPTSRVVYASYAIAGPYLDSLLADNTPLVLVGIGEASVRWALSEGLGEEAANGFLLGTLLQDALLASGRDLTQAALDREFRALDLEERAFLTRSR